MKIEVSKKALSDLEDLFQYSIETFGNRKTEQYLQSIYKKISSLERMPGTGHIHKSLPDYLRVINIESHVQHWR